MKAAEVIAKLLQIERAVGRVDPTSIRLFVHEIQDGVLQLERLLIATLEENEALRERMERCEQSRLHRGFPPRSAETVEPVSDSVPFRAN